MIGLAREVQAITVDPFPASDMNRMKEYDCGPQARAAAQLSPQRPRAERPRLLSDPADLVASLPVGLARLGLELPRVALDPCSGDGALRRGLTPFGIDARLSDLYPERYPEADGYATSQPLDAAESRQLRHGFELAGSDCTAIITNTPHNTVEACAIVRNLIALVEGQHVEFIAVLFRSI